MISPSLTGVAISDRFGGSGDRAYVRRGRALAIAATIALAAVVLGRAMASPSHSREVIALVVGLAFVAAATVAPRGAIYGLVGWLAMLGLLRRVLTAIGSPIGSFGDPLLLVAPAVILALVVLAGERGAFRNLTPLSKTVLALTTVLALSALNPAQGGLSVGLAGLMLVVIPMLSFWIGRTLLSEQAVSVISGLVAALAIVVALYGLAQTFIGIPAWDTRWIKETGYEALHVGSTIRAFGSSVSAAEYASLLAFGIVAWRAIGHRSSRLLAAVAAAAFLAVAAWLESSRGIIVLLIFSLWLAFAAAHRMRLSRALIVGAVLIALIPTAVGHIFSAGSESSAVGSLTNHQVTGLTQPFNKSSSTLNGHLTEMVKGITGIASSPLGNGVGSITDAAGKFEGTAGGTEVDPGNAAVAGGFLGLLFYLGVVLYGLTCAYRLARSRRTVATLAALGIIGVAFLQWLNGGQYLIIFLVWLMLGWVDGETVRAGLPTRVRSSARVPRTHAKSARV